jgi:uncharacterized protein (TIGR02594 family)
MTLPAPYTFLAGVSPLPLTIKFALELLGTIETPGTKDNPVILGWAKELGLSSVYGHDSIPWCGLFTGVIVKRSGKPVVKSPLWARDWLNFGVAVEHAGLGDVLVFGRDGGGHVGFYVGEDDTCYHVLGGNQSDKVCFTRILKSRLLGARRPAYNTQPASVKRYMIQGGGKVSTNEA